MIRTSWPKIPDDLYYTDYNNNKIVDVYPSCVTPIKIVSPGRSIWKLSTGKVKKSAGNILVPGTSIPVCSVKKSVVRVQIVFDKNYKSLLFTNAQSITKFLCSCCFKSAAYHSCYIYQ